VREADWTAAMRVEALGQSVQADVFHLYSIKEGIVYGSVLLNYFVVGAARDRMAPRGATGNRKYRLSSVRTYGGIGGEKEIK